MKRNITNIVLFSVVGASAFGLLLFPKEISLCVHEGLNLCTDSLFPTLFPFLVFSGFLVKSGLAQRIGQPLEYITEQVFSLPGVCSSPLILGLIGGYPTGAKTVVELHRNDLCSSKEAERMLAFCNNCGPGFLVSTIGYGLFGSIHCGLLLYAAHIMASVLTGIILASSDIRTTPMSNKVVTSVPPPLSYAFVLSVTEAMHSFINMAGFVICFSAITCLVQVSGITSILSFLLPFSQGNTDPFLQGLLEVSGGVLRLNGGSVSEQMILAATLIGWGGLSVHCQVLSLLQNTGLSPVLYFKGKTLHALMCALITAAMVGALPFWCTPVCLGIFGTVSYFRKKAVEKKKKVYYNAS